MHGVNTTVAETPRPSRPERIGRYRVVERIGRGAMGVVYAAHDELMGRDVAVKVMMTDLEAEPDIRARFMREAQVSASLAHRNIVTIYDIGEDNGRLFIVMELLRGQTLDKCLKAAGAGDRREDRSRRRGLRRAGGGKRRGRLSPRREAGQPVPAG